MVVRELWYAPVEATYPMSVIDPAPDAARALSPKNNEDEKEESAGDLPSTTPIWDTSRDIMYDRIRPWVIVRACLEAAPALTGDELDEASAEWGWLLFRARDRRLPRLERMALSVLRILGAESDHRAMGRAGRRAA